jgi:hypothetical protein
MPTLPSTNGFHTPHHRETSVVTSAVARDQFEILYPTIRGFLLSQFEAHSMPRDAVEYFTRVCQRPLFFPLVSDSSEGPTKCLDYNAFSGQYKTGLLVVEAAEAFKGRRLNDSEYQNAAILGWVVIFVSSSAPSSSHPPSVIPLRDNFFLRSAALVLHRVGRYHQPSHDETREIVVASCERRRVQSPQ